MALQSPFFNKREPDAYTRQQGTNPNATTTGTANTTAAANAVTTTQTAAPATPAANSAPVYEPVAEGESKLTVGPNIKLKGVEITDCDTLVVEGSVEATMDSRVIQISERGSFKGSAEIDIAEIRGQFEGNLTVRKTLVIFATGKVSGHVRYGEIVIEKGGQLSGEIEFGTSGARASVVNASRPAQVRAAG